MPSNYFPTTNMNESLKDIRTKEIIQLIDELNEDRKNETNYLNSFILTLNSLPGNSLKPTMIRLTLKEIKKSRIKIKNMNLKHNQLLAQLEANVLL